ncbi:hypothetical protein [Thomasclavelia cocleata]|uniref:hypothetical protein n=1 Tax=Thomasclavelia cocleata TaxID=69824 RepID=UPI00242C5215|nr:hypothetical protein [Thomasclavelia cocleata]
MYIYNFLESLKLLKKEAIPNFDCFPKGKVIYYGQYEKEDLLKDGVSIGTLPDNEFSNYYLAYAYVDNVYEINYMAIDEFINYICKLNDEESIAKNANTLKREAAYIEAIWLFDELACLRTNPFFEADITYGYSALSMYKNNGCDQESLLNLFDGNPIRRDIFFAQFFYFVKKYLRHRLIGNKDVILREFNKKTLDALAEYDSESPNHYKSYLVTHDDNSEFDDFLQQLNLLDKIEKK